MADYLSRQERMLKQRVAAHRCPQCRQSFRQEHVRVAARHEDLWVVSVRCAACRKQQVYWIALSDLEDTSDSIMDPSPEEQEHFASLPPIPTDEILDMHDFLTQFDGDFHRLFSGRSRRH
jgi:hypothetical protein